MPDLYGSAVGMMAGDQANNTNAMAKLSLADAALQLQQTQMTMSQQQQMMAKVAQTPLDGYDNATKLDKLAEMAISTGNYSAGEKMIETASKAREQESMAASHKIDTTTKELDLYGSLLQGVHDQDSWSQANAMFQMQTGKPSKFAQVPYNPDLVQKLQQGVQSQKDRVDIEAAKARTAEAKAATQEDLARIPLIRAQARDANALAANREKAGDTVSAPKKEDIKLASDMIMGDNPNAMKEDVNVKAEAIAERANYLMKTNKISRSQATSQAYQEAKGAGDLKGLRAKGTGDTKIDQASGLIDNLISLVQTNPGVSGRISNTYNQVKEVVKNAIPGTAKVTDAHDFETQLNELRLVLPDVEKIKGKNNKGDQQKVSKIVRGLGFGDDAASTLSALKFVKDYITVDASGNSPRGGASGGWNPPSKAAPVERKADGGLSIGWVYTDSKGNKGKYLGGPKNDAASWEAQ